MTLLFTARRHRAHASPRLDATLDSTHAVLRLVRRLALGGALLHLSSAHAAVLLDQNLASGLGEFTLSGSTSTGTYGARLRGGSTPGAMNSRVIGTSGYQNLKLSITRETSGLDLGEAATIKAVVNGQTRTLESVRSATGVVSFNLGNDVSSVSLQFTLAASSSLETTTISRVLLEGDTATGGCPGTDPGCGSSAATSTIVPDASWTCGMPNGIPSPHNGTLVFSATLASGAALQVSPTPYGTRRVTPTSGGAIQSGSVSGSVLGNALDFDLLLPSGAVEHESRHTLRSSSGTLVYMRSCGVAEGNDVRFVANFEAPNSSSLQWLNTGTYIGRRQVTAQGVKISVYSVPGTVDPAAPVIRVPADAQPKQQAWNCTGASANATQGSQVMQARVSIGSSLSIGTSKYGSRNIIPITGGTFTGTAASGNVNAGGADFQLTPPGGSLQIEARYTLQAPNGETIVVRNCGDFANSSLTQVFFEAKTDGAYNSLNTGNFVGTITPGLGRVTINVYNRQ